MIGTRARITRAHWTVGYYDSVVTWHTASELVSVQQWASEQLWCGGVIHRQFSGVFVSVNIDEVNVNWNVLYNNLMWLLAADSTAADRRATVCWDMSHLLFVVVTRDFPSFPVTQPILFPLFDDVFSF